MIEQMPRKLALQLAKNKFFRSFNIQHSNKFNKYLTLRFLFTRSWQW
jgi:hypothetical protein